MKKQFEETLSKIVEGDTGLNKFMRQVASTKVVITFDEKKFSSGSNGAYFDKKSNTIFWMAGKARIVASTICCLKCAT